MKRFLKFYGHLLIMTLLGVSMLSCNHDDLEDPSFYGKDDELTLMVSDSTSELQEKFINNELSFNWSTGTNKGTGSAIRYTLRIDQEGNDFSSPLLIPVEDAKNLYSYSIDHGTLNDRLLDKGLEAGATYELKARVTAIVSTSEEVQTSETSFNIIPFEPVAKQLFIVGNAIPEGLDIGNAAALTSSTSQRGVFIYEGPLSVGSFKFAVSRDACLCQNFYTRDPEDENIIIFNEGGSGDDLQWTITEEGNYKIKVDLLNKSISVGPLEDVPFAQLWIVGDATESGWNVDDPAMFTQSTENPFIFTYEGNFSIGEFKMLAGTLGDFCGEWYRPPVDGQELMNGTVVQTAGCDQDNKWLVGEESVGRYKITLNTFDNTVEFENISLYIVGDGGPSGWDIATPQALTYEEGDFIFNGELGASNPAGEFKLSKFTGDWCNGEWINAAHASQPISNTDFIITQGCDGPDNKWKLQEGEAGTYEIRINLAADTMTISKL